MIPNEPVMRHLKKLTIAHRHPYKLFFKGNKQKMGSKQNIKVKDERKIAGTLKKVKKEKSQNELIFLNITKIKWVFYKEISAERRRSGRIRV